MNKKRTGFYYHPSCLEHDTGHGHPERPARLTAIMEHLTSIGLLEKLDAREPEPCALETIAFVHPKNYVDHIARSCQAELHALDSDTVVSQNSFLAARLAAGAIVEAVDRVSRGEWQNAFCAVRPPGHHAEVAEAMGFCLFNNVAIAAEWLRRNQRAERVLIIDWDVHHGNGTQNIFYERGEVFYFSAHQWPLYPGTGRAEESGTGAGAKATRNLLLPPMTTEEKYLERFCEATQEIFETFQPEFTLISAGFDAHRDDPLAHLQLTETGFVQMTDHVLALAKTFCGARVVSVLEGGYNLNALARSVAAHVERMLAATSTT